MIGGASIIGGDGAKLAVGGASTRAGGAARSGAAPGNAGAAVVAFSLRRAGASVRGLAMVRMPSTGASRRVGEATLGADGALAIFDELSMRIPGVSKRDAWLSK